MMLGKFEQDFQRFEKFYLAFICISGALYIVCFGDLFVQQFVESYKNVIKSYNNKNYRILVYLPVLLVKVFCLSTIIGNYAVTEPSPIWQNFQTSRVLLITNCTNKIALLLVYY